MRVHRRVDGVGRLDDSMYTPTPGLAAKVHHWSGAWSHRRVPLVLESTACVGQTKGKQTQSSSCTTSSGNENVPGPVKTASSSKKGLTSHGL